MSEKTHQPSAQRLREARKQGQLPKSRLFTSSAVTLGALVATLAFANEHALRLRAWTTALLRQPAPEHLQATLFDALKLLLTCLAPSLAGAMVAALASTVVIAGVQVNVDLVSPKLERLNPAEGFKKLFSPRQALEVGKGLLVTAVIGWLLWTSLKDAAPLAVRSLTRDDGALTLPALLELWRPAVLRAAVVLALLGVADQALAHRKHLKGLMMSRDEVKQEHKQQDGDPHHKAKRKSLHKQLASGGAARGLQNATAVVVNPTHIAVALRYDEAECAAPYVVARGREEDALNMRKHAESLGVPVIRDVPLARSLVQLDVGEEVPEELYQAAAAVLKVALEASAELDTVRAERQS